MSEIINKIAKAIYDAERHETKNSYEDMAFAAILALRDNVTHDMVIAGNRCDDNASEMFNIMLNVALEYPKL